MFYPSPISHSPLLWGCFIDGVRSDGGTCPRMLEHAVGSHHKVVVNMFHLRDSTWVCPIPVGPSESAHLTAYVSI